MNNKMKFFSGLFVITLFLTVTLANAQSPADALFDKYSGKEGFTTVYITPGMFELFAEMDTPEDDSSFVKIAKTLKSIKILSLENDSIRKSEGIDFFDEIMNDFPESVYEELMVVRDEDQRVNFYVRRNGNKIAELLMVVGGNDDNALISIQGNIDLKSVAKLSRTMNIHGMENLKKMENEKNHDHHDD